MISDFGSSANATSGNDRLRRIESELGTPALGVRFRFAADFLIGRFKRAQASHFLQDTFGVQFVLETLQRPIHWLTFSNDYFWHG